jgi:hypothetical protein
LVASSWNDWWSKKQINNEEFLKEADLGNLDKIKKYLNAEEMQGQ